MKTLSRVLPSLMVVGLLCLASLAPSAHGSGTSSLGRKSPLSGSVLMAQAIHSGTVKPTGGTSRPRPGVQPNVQASEDGRPVDETPLANNPRNSQQLLTGGNDYNCPSLQGFYASSDGGATWNSTCMATLPGLFGFGDPAVGYDLNNTAYIAGIDAKGDFTDAHIVFEKSTDNGATWSAPAVAVNPTLGGLTDKEWLQIDTNPASPHANTLYISVTQFDPTGFNTEISVSHSGDGGATWTTSVVDTEQLFPTVDQFSDLAIGKDGTVYVSWMRCTANGPTGGCGGTTATLLLSKSTDGGNTWSAPATIAQVNLAPDTCGAFYGCLPNTFERVSEIPVIDISNGPVHAGRLYAAFYNWTGTFMQVQVAASSDGGTTWGAAVPVAPASDTHDQFFPWLSVNSQGVVGVTWLDRRNDPSNVSYEAFATTSSNGGIAFTPNRQIATAPSNPFNDGFGGGFMGDYTGNAWVGKTLYASWSDTRNTINAQDEVGGFAFGR